MRAFAFVVCLVPSAASLAEDYATTPFVCADTTIKRVSARLEDGAGHPVADSGAVMTLANGVYLVSYQTPEVFMRERNGDKVQVSLVGIPRNCPEGDNRGALYRVFDYRQLAAYTMSNSSHTCGGA